MNIGIAQNTVDPEGTRLLDLARQLDVDGVEPMIGDVGSRYLAWTDGDAGCFVDAARRMEVDIPSVAMSVFNGDSALIDADGRERAVELIGLALDLSCALGARTMLLCAYFSSHPDTAEKKDNLTAVLRRVIPAAAERNVRIGLESPLAAGELVWLIDSLATDWVGVYYDVGNAIYHGYDPAAEIRRLGSRIVSIHVKDTDKMLGDSRLGKGRLDLAAVVRALDKIHYTGWLVLETLHGDERTLREDLAVLDRYLGGKGGL